VGRCAQGGQPREGGMVGVDDFNSVSMAIFRFSLP
jgi:hypothetical protein